MKLFLSPHNDDETLFGAFTLLRERPHVVIVTDSVRQAARGTGITAAERRAETLAALKVMGLSDVTFLGIADERLPATSEWWERLRALGEPDHVWAPAFELDGNVDHNAVAAAVTQLGWTRVTRYLTYTPAGKSVGRLVPCDGGMVLRKLQALACYRSQIMEPSTREHFLRGLHEYYA